mmetsp:Transcript_8031/g.24725  ORF Transcript_8031/g.24725 Transcript_8031/m.24725 type:complete len:214 (-) Transcript_8031:3836-4477(-)
MISMFARGRGESRSCKDSTCPAGPLMASAGVISASASAWSRYSRSSALWSESPPFSNLMRLQPLLVTAVMMPCNPLDLIRTRLPFSNSASRESSERASSSPKSMGATTEAPTEASCGVLVVAASSGSSRAGAGAAGSCGTVMRSSCSTSTASSRGGSCVEGSWVAAARRSCAALTPSSCVDGCAAGSCGAVAKRSCAASTASSSTNCCTAGSC